MSESATRVEWEDVTSIFKDACKHLDCKKPMVHTAGMPTIIIHYFIFYRIQVTNTYDI